MLRTLAATTLAIFASAAGHAHHRQIVKHRRGCNTAACDVRADRAFARHEQRKREHERASGWAIPWYIVNCESKGQNLPPNSATAAGYYQIIESTWSSHGGPTDEGRRPNANEWPKSVQDAVARRIAAKGGLSEWDCA